jgi:hypothetical protein
MGTLAIRLQRTLTFWRAAGTAGLLRLALRKGHAVFHGQPLLNPLPADGEADAHEPPSPKPQNVFALREQHFPNLRPFKAYRVPGDGRRRVTVVTDSISKGSLFGGVGTALILGVQLANRLDATLRVLTRTEAAPPENVAHVLAVYGMALAHEPQFAFASVHEPQHEVELLAGELFLTTSWWTTAATLGAVPPSDILYLLQEDERMFYPFGDERLMCERVLARTDIRFAVNTELLYRHLTNTGLPNIAECGMWFEPAFPQAVFRPTVRPAGSKLRFFFYARPGNARNLFFLGAEAIHRAMERGILDPDEWDICWVGKHIPALELPGGVQAQRLEELDWADYAAFIGGVDLALSLMYTPHPSYPPLDVAASGGVVVTNRHGSKQDLSGYCRNILCVECDVDELVEGLRRGVALASSPQRQSNFAQAGLNRSWDAAFGPIVDSVVGR